MEYSHNRPRERGDMFGEPKSVLSCCRVYLENSTVAESLFLHSRTHAYADCFCSVVKLPFRIFRFLRLLLGSSQRSLQLRLGERRAPHSSASIKIHASNVVSTGSLEASYLCRNTLWGVELVIPCSILLFSSLWNLVSKDHVLTPKNAATFLLRMGGVLCLVMPAC